MVISVSLIVFTTLNILHDSEAEKLNLEAWDRSRGNFNNEIGQLISTSSAMDNNKTSEISQQKQGDILCVINFVRIKKRVPVLIGISEKNLSQGVGWNESTVKPGAIGNAQLFGHRDTSFSFLKNVIVGDSIIVETREKNYEFTVYKTLITTPEDIKSPEEINLATLQMITCYPFSYIGKAPKRYSVYAKAK